MNSPIKGKFKVALEHLSNQPPNRALALIVISNLAEQIQPSLDRLDELETKLKAIRQAANMAEVNRILAEKPSDINLELFGDSPLEPEQIEFAKRLAESEDVTLTEEEIDWLARHQFKDETGYDFYIINHSCPESLNGELTHHDFRDPRLDLYVFHGKRDTEANRAAIESRRKELGLE